MRGEYERAGRHLAEIVRRFPFALALSRLAGELTSSSRPPTAPLDPPSSSSSPCLSRPTYISSLSLSCFRSFPSFSPAPSLSPSLSPDPPVCSLPQVHDNLDTPLHLNAIRIFGAKSTRPSFLSRIFAPYLSPLPPPSFLSSSFSPSSSPAPPPQPQPQQTLRTLLQATRDLSSTLEHFDLFRGVDATIERSDSVLAERDDVEIVLRVVEAPKYFLRTATDVGDGEGNAVSPLLPPSPLFLARASVFALCVRAARTSLARSLTDGSRPGTLCRSRRPARPRSATRLAAPRQSRATSALARGPSRPSR